jgi:hypothetical protein
MEKALRRTAGALALSLFLPACYLSNTAILPGPEAFHRVEEAPFTQGVSGIASGGGVSVAVSHDSAVIAYSEDGGVTWKTTGEIEGNFSDGIQLNAVVWGEGWFLAGGDGGKAAYSADGVKWQAGVIGPMSPKNILALAVGCIEGRTVFVAAGNDGRIAHSTGGPEGPWYMAPLSPFGTVENYGEAIRDLAYGRVYGTEVFVAVGDSGKIAYMKDLSGRWYGGRAGTDQTLRSVAFGNKKFIAAGDSGTIKISSDPPSCEWTTVRDENLGLRTFTRIGFDPVSENFILTSADSIVSFSRYGLAWNAAAFQRHFEPGNLSALDCSASRILLGGSNGTMLYSNE